MINFVSDFIIKTNLIKTVSICISPIFPYTYLHFFSNQHMYSGFVFDESYQADGQWHHFCLTRAEFYNTDYFQVFADGQQIQQGRVPRRRRFTRRMNLQVLPEVGHETIRISGLALWYNRFSPGQIAWLSRGCSNTPPQHSQLINVLTWSQVLTHVRNLPWYKIPSTCDVQEDSNNKK